jgi:hypothetical protein
MIPDSYAVSWMAHGVHMPGVMMTAILVIGFLVAVVAGLHGYYSDYSSPADPSARTVDGPDEPIQAEPRPYVPDSRVILPRIPVVDTVRTASGPVVQPVFLPALPPLLPVAPEDVDGIGYPWWDDRACWGCSKGCKRSNFHPYGFNVGAEIRGACAARARADRESPGAYHGGFASDGPRRRAGARLSTSVDAIWDHDCEECGRAYRRDLYGLDTDRNDDEDETTEGPADGLDVVVADCPF